MGLSESFSTCLRVIIYFIIILCGLMFLPGIPPNMVFESFTVKPAIKLEGKLARNIKLNSAEALVKDKLLGPESIAIRGDDELYTGTIGGEVIRIKNGEIFVVTKFGNDCEGKHEEALCGRPLGMRFDGKGKLLVTDAYYGLFKVDVDTGNFETLVSSKDKIDGKRPLCPNDLDVSKSGEIYWSDSSTNVHLQDALFEFLGQPTGRLLKYDPVSKKSTLLISSLRFANGVQLFPDESSVLVSETAQYRVWRYYLKGPKAGSKEIFVDGLPGSPDNIRSNGRDGFFISLIAPRYADKFSLLDFLSTKPNIRKLLLRLLNIVDSTLYLIDSLIPNFATKNALYYVGHLEPIASIFPKHGNIIELNQNGEIINSLQDFTGRVHHISQITVDKNGQFAYLGSPYNSEVWKINLDSIRSNEESNR